MLAKTFILHCLRIAGCFAIAQKLTRKHLRILCYHGFAIEDEYKIAPFMFMREETFERRMKVLKRRRIPIITLEEAVIKLKRNDIENAETVITMDDGWASNLTIGLPILKRYGCTACIYVTTEHLSAGTEVFNVVLYHMVRNSTIEHFTLRSIHPSIDGRYMTATADDTVIRIIKGVENLGLSDRQRLLHPIAAALGIDLESFLRNERFRLLTKEEIQRLYAEGVDIQLHSHTHCLPEHDFQAAAHEIAENQRAVKEILGEDKHHFCYPSGLYAPEHPAWLEAMGIVSATTCDTGMNPPQTSPLLLKRFLDRDDLADIEFEAEICGVRELARELRRRLRPFSSYLQSSAPGAGD